MENGNPSPSYPVVPMRTSKWIVPIALIIIGLLVVVAGFVVIRQQQIPKNYIHTTGTVENAVYEAQNDENLDVKFSVNNQTYTFTSTISRSAYLHDSEYFIGSNRLKIAYNPESPSHDVKNVSYKAKASAVALIFIVVGCLFAILGLLSLLTSLSKLI